MKQEYDFEILNIINKKFAIYLIKVNKELLLKNN